MNQSTLRRDARQQHPISKSGDPVDQNGQVMGLWAIATADNAEGQADLAWLGTSGSRFASALMCRAELGLDRVVG